MFDHVNIHHSVEVTRLVKTSMISHDMEFILALSSKLQRSMVLIPTNKCFIIAITVISIWLL